MIDLRAVNITVEADDIPLVRNANMRLAPGELVAMLGPNGAGKTTLLRASMGIEKPASGQAFIGDIDVQKMSSSVRARRLAYLPQTRPLAWPSRVLDVVALGRFSHGANLGQLKGEDLSAVHSAIEACDITHLKDREVHTLSGGELARMHCARAFAAQAPLMIADEPVAALDPRHQFRVMDLIRAYVENGGGALVVLHDISLAAKYADRLIWMRDGAVIADGSPEDTLSEDRLAEIYQVKAIVKGRSVRIEGAL